MANIKSAIKRQKQNIKRRARNRAIKSSVRTRIKALKKAISEGNLEKATELFPVTVKEINKAASKGVFHKNNSSRKVSRLASQLQKHQKDTLNDQS